MKKAIALFIAAAALLALTVGLQLFRPPNTSSSDPEVTRLEDDYAALVGYATDAKTKAAEADQVLASLWSHAAVDAFIRDLPGGWSAQRLSIETKSRVQLCRYAFSKDAAQLRDYPEFVRVLKKLEERRATRIEGVSLVLNQDGQRFASALITATLPLPLSPNNHEHP